MESKPCAKVRGAVFSLLWPPPGVSPAVMAREHSSGNLPKLPQMAPTNCAVDASLRGDHTFRVSFKALLGLAARCKRDNFRKGAGHLVLSAYRSFPGTKLPCGMCHPATSAETTPITSSVTRGTGDNPRRGLFRKAPRNTRNILVSVCFYVAFLVTPRRCYVSGCNIISVCFVSIFDIYYGVTGAFRILGEREW